MRIFYKPSTLKALLLPLLALAMSISYMPQAFGQVVQIGGVTTSTTGYPNPFAEQHRASRQQYLWLASELKAVGMLPGKINEVRFYKQSYFGVVKVLDEISVGGKQTTVNALNNSSWETTTPAVTLLAWGIPTTNSWVTFAFPPGQEIVWDGVQNILIDVCVNGNMTTSTNPLTAYMTTSFNSSHSSASNTTGTGCGATGLTTQGTQTWRPSVQFKFAPNCIVPDSINLTNIDAFSADLSWPPSPSGSSYIRAYNWVYWQKDKPKPAGYNGTGPTLMNHNLDFLTPETCYYVRLQADCKWKGAATDTSDWILDSFCTIADCVPPVVTVDRVTSTTAVGSWPPVPTAYDYEYAVSVLATPPVAGTRTTSTAVQLMGLASAKDYHLFVRAYCAQTPVSEWTEVVFRTMSALNVNDVTNGFSLSAYPNPVKDMMTLKLQNPLENATIMVTDLTGKLISTTAVTGDKVDINMSSLTPGIYLVKYSDRLNRKMIKITKE